MEFPKEQIPDEDDLFLRIHKDMVRYGAIIPFGFRHSSLSSNWSEYADAELTRNQARLYDKDPNNYGVVELRVADVRSIPNQKVDHDPLPENQAHTNIIGEKDEEARLKLTDFSQWVIHL